jgi:hypothetical protein
MAAAMVITSAFHIMWPKGKSLNLLLLENQYEHFVEKNGFHPAILRIFQSVPHAKSCIQK